jgi:hypothetical protein
MRQAAVVLTYPAHFLHSARTVASIRQHHPDITDFTVVIDDWSNLSWPTYVSDARAFYGNLGCQVVPATQLDFLAYITKPWVRQQTIKLYLDQLLDTQQWFFSDGDCELLEPWPYLIRSAHPVPWGKTGQGFVDYVRSMLIQPGWSGFRDEQDRYVTTSAPPVRDMRSCDLIALRDHVKHLHSKEIWVLHLDQQNDPEFTPTEWELMDRFDVAVQQLDICFQNHRHRVTMSWESDTHYGKDHWRDFDISESLWNRLPLARYL